jgi:flagella basal body P-ring formation protein FlgA
MRILLTLAFVALSAHSAIAADADAVRAAISGAVASRLGPGAEIAIASLQITATSQGGVLTARPEPGARLGRASVFSLTVATETGPRRVGSAVAVVTAIATRLEVTRPLQAGDVVTAGDVNQVRGAVAEGPLKPLPIAEEAIGARVVGRLAAGAVVTAGNIRPVPLVRSGQQVTLKARVGAIEARGLGIAVENGQSGSLVHVVNPDSRRTLIGRVVGAGEVEVVHGS